MGNLEEQKDIIISYETLFEMLRIERSRTDLQSLPKTFLEEVKELLDKEIKGINSLREEEHKKKKEIFLKNTKKILNEIYERREKKILSLALAKSKTKTALIDFSKFLDFEKILFEQIINILDSNRNLIIDFMRLNSPVSVDKDDEQKNGKANAVSEISATSEIYSPTFSSSSSSNNIVDENSLNNVQESKEKDESGKECNLLQDKKAVEEKGEKDIVLRKIKNKETAVIRFISQFPRILGPDLLEYGPYDEEDIANLPRDVADLLISKKRAEEIIL